MSGYSKEDYDRLYSIRVVFRESRRRSPIRLHYHRYVMQEMVQRHWDYLVDKLGITSKDKVVVVGAGFGWGIEKLVELTGCTVIGTEISDHIMNSKGVSEEAEIDAAIVAAGYDPKSGHGLEVKNEVYHGEARCNCTIINEDMYSPESRERVQDVLGGTPTWIITEDMLSDFSDEEALAWKAQVDKMGTKVCHLVRTHDKTAQAWHDLTGHTIVEVGNHERTG